MLCSDMDPLFRLIGMMVSLLNGFGIVALIGILWSRQTPEQMVESELGHHAR